MFQKFTIKNKLKKAFSDCFQPLKSDLDNVPLPMQKDRFITASILGTCRGYTDALKTDEKTFLAVVDAVFEEVFRQDSLTVQTLTESWLNSADEVFMPAYYDAKHRAFEQLDLSWLQQYAQANFEVAFQVNHST